MTKLFKKYIILFFGLGVWPESKSFSDRGIGPIPAKWRGGNICQLDKLNTSKKVPCNRFLFQPAPFLMIF